MRNKFFSLSIPFFVITALILAACPEPEKNLITKKECKITFTVVGAAAAYETPKPITIGRGGTMGDQYPTDPVFATASMMEFDGWIDSGIRYDADTPINSDLDLTAKWVPKGAVTDLVTVTFDSDGGTAVPDMRVPRNKPIGLRLPVSRKKNYTFNGWYDTTLTTQYTATAPDITANSTSLKAKWTIKPTHTVSFRTFDVNAANSTVDQCIISSVTVHEGEGLEDDLPDATAVTHTDSKVKFVRWIGEENELYDGFTPIYEDMTFYAKWGLDPYVVDLSQTTLYKGESTPDVMPAYNAETGTIKNTVKYDGAANRWYIMYRIGLNLPNDFNMGYYTRYNVRAKFYGNERAIKGNPLYSSAYMDDANAITAVGQEMPPKPGYGQISWCINETSNGNPGQDKAGVIAQQYNLGTSTISQQWLIAGDFKIEGDPRYSKRPPVLLIQTSDNWIGWIEITQIAFHNGEEEFLDPPTED
jgi:uncharacterized repeat protein (TIGR02543 family)